MGSGEGDAQRDPLQRWVEGSDCDCDDCACKEDDPDTAPVDPQ